MSNKFLSVLQRLICVPKCAGCGKRISPIVQDSELSHGRTCLCDSCMEEWQIKKRMPCHICSMIAEDCTCCTYSKKLSGRSVPSLAFYHPTDAGVINNVIYTMKRKRSGELLDFLAQELSGRVENLLKNESVLMSDCVLTYIPRSKSAEQKYNLDQGEELCLALSRRLGGASFLPLFIRKGGAEQKKLDVKARKENIRSTVFLNPKIKVSDLASPLSLSEYVKGKSVIIVDDVITTGATVDYGVALLMEAGASKVFAVCVAKSEMRSKK